eukprot:scaffold107916_cov25-Prasinocladus_malaysianus.AAC.3
MSDWPDPPTLHVQASRASMWKLSSAVDPERPDSQHPTGPNGSTTNNAADAAGILSVVDEDDEFDDDMYDFVHPLEAEAMQQAGGDPRTGNASQSVSRSMGASRPPSALRRPSSGSRTGVKGSRGISFVKQVGQADRSPAQSP